MNLREVVESYTKLASGFGQPVALDDFGLAAEETAKLFSALDEDYHFSRFFHFSSSVGQSYLISGAEVTHISIDAGIQAVL